jgi:hypothetical protein
MIRRATLTSCCLLSCLAACSGSSGGDAGNSPDGGGNPGNDGGGGGPDGGGGGPDGGSCGPFSRTFSGQLSYVHTRIGVTTGEVAVAFFFTAPQTESGTTCGGCSFTPVSGFDGGSDGGTKEAAGNLTLVNLRTNDGGAMIQLTTPVEYETFTVPWVGGDSLKMTGTGGAFPAFSVTMQQPDTLAGLSPNPLGAIVNVSRSASLTATWTPSAAPAGIGMLFSLSTDAGVVLCLSPDSAGSVTVPASVLGNFASGTRGSVVFQRNASVLDTSTGQGIVENAAIMQGGTLSVTP